MKEVLTFGLVTVCFVYHVSGTENMRGFIGIPAGRSYQGLFGRKHDIDSFVTLFWEINKLVLYPYHPYHR